MRKFIFYFTALLSLHLGIVTGYGQTTRHESIKADVYYLASDSLAGRKPGTEGGNKAAVYIREVFRSAGLQLAGDEGFQYFDVVTDVSAGPGNSMSVENTSMTFGTDYMPFSFSSSASVKAAVVFAGYGFTLDMDTLKWNDYDGLDVTGKWVMVIRGHPEPEADNSVFAAVSKDRGKALTAKDRGAAGVLMVTGTAWDKNDALISLSYDKSIAGSGIPVINITRKTANMILAGDGFSIESLEDSLRQSRKPFSKHTSCTLRAITDLKYKSVRTQNVIGILYGSDTTQRGQYIIAGAHYDHLGLGGPGSGSRRPDTIAVHYGADDNASGVAALLALARSWENRETRPKRTIVLIAFGAEEMGLLGSSWFASHPLVDLSRTIMMMNFDMIGRLNPENPVLAIGGTGTAAEFPALLEKHTKDAPFRTVFSPEGYGPSDHAVFYAKDIPVLYFNTGVHQDYHTPADRPQQINYEGMEKVIALARNIINDLAGDDQKLTFTEAGPKEKNPHGYGLKVKLGIMPDFTATEIKGLRIGGITKGGPADAAGMVKGDIITAIDGKAVENIYDYMERLKSLTPGQLITVDVKRGGEEKVLIVTL